MSVSLTYLLQFGQKGRSPDLASCMLARAQTKGDFLTILGSPYRASRVRETQYINVEQTKGGGLNGRVSWTATAILRRWKQVLLS